MEILLALCSIVSFVCLIIVVAEIASEKGILWALLGFCLCQIYAFYYGWVESNSHMKGIVMPIWTIAIIVSLVLRFGMGVSVGAVEP